MLTFNVASAKATESLIMVFPTTGSLCVTIASAEKYLSRLSSPMALLKRTSLIARSFGIVIVQFSRRSAGSDGNMICVSTDSFESPTRLWNCAYKQSHKQNDSQK